eukprot:TRINITY_DN322_c0_g3_i3.p1 TRINITY_DN322_c0_g3~~TRINITY_DN322_c0_g3_i3.p1  ORF type:complete len:537 (-),score=97.55 TRINITY_DN322_c0_g3_i3:1175-2785(-)
MTNVDGTPFDLGSSLSQRVCGGGRSGDFLRICPHCGFLGYLHSYLYIYLYVYIHTYTYFTVMKRTFTQLSVFFVLLLCLLDSLSCEERSVSPSCVLFEWETVLPLSDPLSLSSHPEATFLPQNDECRWNPLRSWFFSLTKGLWRGQEWGFSQNMSSLWLPGATLALESPSSSNECERGSVKLSRFLRTHLSSRLGISLDVDVPQSSMDGSPMALRRQVRKTWYRVGQKLPLPQDPPFDVGRGRQGEQMMLFSWPRERLCIDSIRRFVKENGVWETMEHGLREMGVADVLDLLDMAFIGMKVEWDGSNNYELPVLRLSWVDCGNHERSGNEGNSNSFDAATVPVVFENWFHPRGSMCIYLPRHGMGDTVSQFHKKNDRSWNVTISVALPRSINPLSHTLRLHLTDHSGDQGQMKKVQRIQQQHPWVTLAPSSGLIISANDVVSAKETAFCFDIEKRFLGAHDYGPFVYDGFIVPPTIVKMWNDQTNETWWAHSSALVITGPRPDAGMIYTVVILAASVFLVLIVSLGRVAIVHLKTG